METWISALLGGIGVAVVGVLGNLLLERQRRRKTAAEARSTEADYSVKVTSQYDKLAERLAGQVEELTRKQEAVEKQRQAEQCELADLKAKVLALTDKVKEQAAVIAGQEARIAALTERVTEQEIGIAQLTAQVRRLGGEPEWKEQV